MLYIVSLMVIFMLLLHSWLNKLIDWVYWVCVCCVRWIVQRWH